MAATIYNGSDLMLFVGGKSIACATSHSLSVSIDTTESSTKCKDYKSGAWKTFKSTDMSWTVSTENLYASTGGEGKSFDDLMALKGTEVTIVFAPSSESDNTVITGGWTPKANTGYTGNAILTSLEVSAQDGENATFSASFQGTGELKAVTEG